MQISRRLSAVAAHSANLAGYPNLFKLTIMDAFFTENCATLSEVTHMTGGPATTNRVQSGKVRKNLTNSVDEMGTGNYASDNS